MQPRRIVEGYVCETGTNDYVPTYQCQVLLDDGWYVYREGRRYTSRRGASTLLPKLAARYGQDRVRLATPNQIGKPWPDKPKPARS